MSLYRKDGEQGWLSSCLVEVSESNVEDRQEISNYPTNYVIPIVLNVMKGKNRVLYVKKRPVLIWKARRNFSDIPHLR